MSVTFSMKLSDLFFNDCIIVGFSRDSARRTLTLTFEAYDTTNLAPEPDTYILECAGVSNDRLQVSSEFQADLSRPYDFQGDDQRANEIYELHRDTASIIHLSADMISGSIKCESYRLLRVVQVEAVAREGRYLSFFSNSAPIKLITYAEVLG